MHGGELAGQGRAEQVSSLRTEAVEHRKSKTSHGQRNHLRKGLYLVGLVDGHDGGQLGTTGLDFASSLFYVVEMA